MVGDSRRYRSPTAENDKSVPLEEIRNHRLPLLRLVRRLLNLQGKNVAVDTHIVQKTPGRVKEAGGWARGGNGSFAEKSKLGTPVDAARDWCGWMGGWVGG